MNATGQFLSRALITSPTTATSSKNYANPGTISQAGSVDGGNVSTYPSILLCAVLIPFRRQRISTDDDNGMDSLVCLLIWVWKYIRLKIPFLS